MKFDPEAKCPLDGLLVLDLSRLVCGNMLSLCLADFGAEVVKIEEPGRGDPLRDWRTDGISIHWKVYARNKRSLALDLRSEEGKAVLKRLLPRADVLIESFKPGSLERMGLGPDVLLGINPRLVVVRVSGFGQTGAYRDRPGFGTLVEAMSGFAAKTGFPDRPPVLPSTSLADMIAGLYGAFATMVALRARGEKSGGQVIDLSLLEPMISFLGPDPAIFALNGRIPQRTGSRSQMTAPRNVWRTADGKYLAISASMQSMAERLLRTIGRPELIDDPRFRTNTDRVRNIDEIDAIVGDWIAQRSLDENLQILQAAGVTAGPVYDVSQLVADPHVRTRDVLVNMPDEEAGSVLMHNIIPRLSRTPGAMRHAAPRLGADSRDVLQASGFAQAEIDRLIEAGAVAAAEEMAP
jgi:crotonobetainyl-CoA:carnitine CoA-transferase CaiB-like acyl-CoA transferase